MKPIEKSSMIQMLLTRLPLFHLGASLRWRVALGVVGAGSDLSSEFGTGPIGCRSTKGMWTYPRLPKSTRQRGSGGLGQKETGLRAFHVSFSGVDDSTPRICRSLCVLARARFVSACQAGKASCTNTCTGCSSADSSCPGASPDNNPDRGSQA